MYNKNIPVRQVTADNKQKENEWRNYNEKENFGSFDVLYISDGNVGRLRQ